MIEWHNCYKEVWKGIQPESFAHPAKFSRGLIRAIYKYAIDQGWLSPGDTVVDPFGGVALGAIDALQNGLNWLGIELEQKFVDMGMGCDCTGISKKDWVRFYDRWERVAYHDGRYWCPRCLSQARIEVDSIESTQLSLFETEPEQGAWYVCNSGQIPSTDPHRYDGNIALFENLTGLMTSPGTIGRPVARLVKGDSRKLIEIIQSADGIVSSPPYAQSLDRGTVARRDRIQYARSHGESNAEHISPIDLESVGQRTQDYGQTPGQLGKMKAGDPQAVISSPPFAGNTGGRGQASREGIDAALFDRHSGGMVRGMGESDGNLGSLRPVGFDGVISSPPFVACVGSDDPDKRGGLFRDEKRRKDKNLTSTYGNTSGQLGMMADGQPDGLISSPPYERSVSSQDKGGIDWNKAGRPDRTKSSPRRNGVQGDMSMAYGEGQNNIGNAVGETFWSAARQIIEQCFLVLPPDGVTIWVCKDFVKDGERVHFADQWRLLCEACGFETLETIRAWVVEERGAQVTIEGKVITHKVERKSFFRRLAEKNGSPRIDWEEVICMRKPGVNL